MSQVRHGTPRNGPAASPGKRGREEELTVQDILVDHLPQLTRKLDSRRSAATDNKVQKLLALLLRRTRQGRLLEVVHDAAADRLRVLDGLELVAVLEAGDAVSAVDRAAGDDELVVREVEVLLVSGALDFEEPLRHVDVDGTAKRARFTRQDRIKNCTQHGHRGAEGVGWQITHRPWRKCPATRAMILRSGSTRLRTSTVPTVADAVEQKIGPDRRNDGDQRIETKGDGRRAAALRVGATHRTHARADGRGSSSPGRRA